MFDQIETGQELPVTENSPFSYWQLADTGIKRILVMLEYTHAYRTWNNIVAYNCTWVQLELHFQESYLDREELEQTAGAAGYGSANNEKHGKMRDAFMNFASSTAARDAAFTKLTTTNGTLSTQSRQQDYQIQALQSE